MEDRTLLQPKQNQNPIPIKHKIQKYYQRSQNNPKGNLCPSLKLECQKIKAPRQSPRPSTDLSGSMIRQIIKPSLRTICHQPPKRSRDTSFELMRQHSKEIHESQRQTRKFRCKVESIKQNLTDDCLAPLNLRTPVEWRDRTTKYRILRQVINNDPSIKEHEKESEYSMRGQQILQNLNKDQQQQEKDLTMSDWKAMSGTSFCRNSVTSHGFHRKAMSQNGTYSNIVGFNERAKTAAAIVEQHFCPNKDQRCPLQSQPSPFQRSRSRLQKRLDMMVTLQGQVRRPPTTDVTTAMNTNRDQEPCSGPAPKGAPSPAIFGFKLARRAATPSKVGRHQNNAWIRK